MASDRKRVLGRGLESLLGDSINERTKVPETVSEFKSGAIIQEIPVGQIETNPFQPRTEFDKEALLELSSSIKELGIIQPITVRKLSNNKYQIISGERRWRASQAAGLKAVPAYIRVANDQAMLEMALVENIQRRDLNPVEVALSYQRLIDECDLTQEELSERIGKNRSSTTNYLRLLKLPAEVQAALVGGAISFGHGRALAALEDEEVQLYIFNQILKESWSVRKLEEAISAAKNPTKIPDRKSKALLSFEQQKFKEDLKARLDVKVDLKPNNKGGGNIVIQFKSEDELKRIMSLLDA